MASYVMRFVSVARTGTGVLMITFCLLKAMLLDNNKE